MGDTGFFRFPGTLDPRAQEFIPTNHLPLLPPQIYYPYPYPSPTEVPVMPFCDAVLGYSQFPVPPAYVRPAAADPPLPPSLPPPSMTPSRTLLLSSVPTDVSESTVRGELEVFGDVRAVLMERVRDGIVTVHFYDLRHAQAALVEIQDQHMQHQCRLRKHFDAVLTHNSLYEPANFPVPLPPPARGLISGRTVWAQFMIPVTVGYPEGYNQGTLVLFNVDSQVPTNYLKEIFEAFGSIKEVRETPLKRHQKFIEFYDTREAAKALAEMNEKVIHGKHVIIEFSRPGGQSKRFSKAPQNDSNKFNFITNYSARSPRCLVASPPLSEERSPAYVHPHCHRKSRNPNGGGGGGNRKTNGGGIVQGAMASLRLNGGDGIEGSNSTGYRLQKKNSKKSLNHQNSSGTILIKKQPQQTNNKGVSKLWKGSRNSKEYDPRFLIKEDAILVSNCSDSRTTVMIKNIPNKYSQKLLLNMLDNHCIHCNEQIAHGDDQPLSSYDFVYLPIDFINKCNVGYGFVNMTSPQASLRLYKSFHLQNWEVFNSRKICQVTYARLQGVEALKEHFKSSKFPCEAEEYMPVVFSPPRDGRRLTHPVPIVANSNNNINSPFQFLLSPPAVTSSKEEEEEVYSSGDSISDDDDVIKEVEERNDDEDSGKEYIKLKEDVREINYTTLRRSGVSMNISDDASGGSLCSTIPNGGDDEMESRSSYV